MDFDFLVFVDVDVDDDFVLLAQVGHLDHLAGSLSESLACIVFLDDDLDAVGDIGRHLAAWLEAQPLNEVFFLAALHAVVVDL